MKITHVTCFPNATRRHSHLFCAHRTPVAAEHCSRTSIWMIRHIDIQKLQTQSVSPGDGRFYRNQLRRNTTSVVFTSRSVWPIITYVQWQQWAGHCAQLSQYFIALHKLWTQTQRPFTWTCCWLLLEQLTAARGHCRWTACSGQQSVSKPYKGQINIGITDYSQRISPRRWAACRDGDPSAVLMPSHLLQKLSTCFSCSQLAFHFRTIFWVSELCRDLRTGSDHCQAQPDMNGESDHCQAQPGMNSGSDHCQAQPDMNGGSDHCQAQPDMNGGSDHCQAQPDMNGGSDHCQAQPDMNSGSDHCQAQPDMNGGSDHCQAQPDMNGGSDHCQALRGSWLKTTALPIIYLRFSFRISAGTPTILIGEFRSFSRSLKTVP